MVAERVWSVPSYREWIWTTGLAAVGILTLTIGGINKLSVVVGPFLIAASICSIFRQNGSLEIEKEIPILVIVLGFFLLLVQILRLPTPAILKPDKESDGS